MGDLRELNGGVTEERPVLSSLSTLASSFDPRPSVIGAERWDRAEKATQKILCKVQPTAVSEERRREVIDYVQRLIRGSLGCEVLPYGSVPLKTYLPDGDIDLTAFGGASVEDALASDMVSVLEAEDQNIDAEFIVKDVQLIRAEVKLVKCIVQNIVVDISFNQIGGLCTLCFLEQVDRLVGKGHLFKRSIILIKAWCYYESRILGAHHGLISTYALETLVLYIFHLFHSTLNGPLAVLYKFLDYFSKFDWDNYCISLNGPVRISSLPDIVAETPENVGTDLLLSNDFLTYCVNTFSVPSRSGDINSRAFPQKHLNIVDPLKESNNLGRSVSKGNFYRIRSAFTYGARQLGRILLQPEETLADELVKFFSNTLDRHGSGQRPDVQDPVPTSGPNYSTLFSTCETEPCRVEKVAFPSESANRTQKIGDCSFNIDISPSNGLNHNKASGGEVNCCQSAGGVQSDSMEVHCSPILSKADGSEKENGFLECRVSGDAKDLATSRLQGLKISGDLTKASPCNGEESSSPMGIAYHAPHLYFSNSALGNGKLSSGNSKPQPSEHCENDDSSGLPHTNDKESDAEIGYVRGNNLVMGSHNVLSFGASKNVASALNGDWTSTSKAGSTELLLSDLAGDYDNHFNCLQYGRWCYEYSLSRPASPMTPSLPSPFHGKNLGDTMQRSLPFKRNGLVGHGVPNGVITNPRFYSVSPLLMPNMVFGLEEMPKPRGTGTYFPNMSRPPQGYRPSTVRGRNHASPRGSPRNNGRAMTFTESNLFERSSREPSQSQFVVDQGVGKPEHSDVLPSVSPCGKVHQYVNGSIPPPPPEGVVEFGSVGHVPLVVPLLESSRQPRIAPSIPQTSSVQGLPTPGMQRPKFVHGLDQDRVALQSSYRLKDEDFPPLSA